MSLIYGSLRRLKYYNFFFFHSMLYVADLFRPKLLLPRDCKVILNCGLPRSGTTVLHLMLNLIRATTEGSEQKYVNTSREFNEAVQEYQPIHVIKTHRYFPALSRYVRSGQVIPVVAHRDLRDAVVSLRSRGWIGSVDEAARA